MVVASRLMFAPVPVLRALQVPPDLFAVVKDEAKGSMRERASFELIPRITVACPFRVNSISREGTRKKQQQITPTDIHCDSFRRYGDGFILISDKWHPPPPSIFRSVEVCRSRQTVRPQESHASRQAALARTNATLAHIDQGAICSPNLWSGHPPAGMMNMMDVETSICSEWCAAWRVTNR